MNTRIFLFVAILLVSAGCQIQSNKPHVVPDNRLFKTDKVYQYGHDYIKFNKDKRYRLLEANGKHKDLSIEHFNKKGTSAFYIIEVDFRSIREKTRKHSHGMDRSLTPTIMYRFIEKTGKGHFYQYAPLWLTKTKGPRKNIYIKSRAELHKIAKRIFAQGRKNAARRIATPMERDKNSAAFKQFMVTHDKSWEQLKKRWKDQYEKQKKNIKVKDPSQRY